jgi:PhzF family phenazine biosynthesis protein
VYAREKGIERGTIVQKTGAGNLPMEIVDEEGDKRIVMTQARVEFGSELDGAHRDTLLTGLNLSADEIETGLPIQIVSTGHSKVMVPIRKRSVLDSIEIDPAVLSGLSAGIGCNGFYVFTFDSGEEGILTSGRMFAPAIGINEDPVTGNANGPLGAYLTRYGRIPKKKDGYTFEIKQGEVIGRKGYMKVHVYSGENGPELVKISGRACIAFRTEIII